MARRVVIRWDDQAVGGRWRSPRSARHAAILLAHGAGTDQDHPAVASMADGLARLGHPVLTFNYPYRERGAGRPDRQPVLLRCHRAALAWLARRHAPIVLAGRSMGGRMATHLVAGDDDHPPADVLGAVLYAYPLHPAGRPDRLRVEHLDRIAVPLLFFTGSRDALALPELVDRWLRPLPTATLETIDEADHGFRVPKRTGWTPDTLRGWMLERTHQWIAGLPGSEPDRSAERS